ncbi:chaplin [Streptomyces sp. NPDC001046]|uniref:chaplin n=1 Tax=Streptomyces sp. NPDC001046 TaxID=3364543 RepID=UPI0036764CF6
MRQTLNRGVVAAAAATGILSLCGGAALADTTADGVAKGSPGVVSGNTVQVPVEVPVNACGNTVDVAAGLNPAFGNSCANGGDGGKGRHADERHDSSGTSERGGDGPSRGHAEDTPSGGGYGDEGHGNDEPDDGGYGDGGYGEDDGGYGDDDGGYGYGDTPPTKPPQTPPATPPHTPPPTTPPHTPPPSGHESTPPATPPGGPEQPPSLPETGAEEMWGAAAASVVMITGGVVLYRRGRAASHR